MAGTAEAAPAKEAESKPAEYDPVTAQRAVLDDPELPPEDYMRAASDPEFLAELAEKRHAAGEGTGEGETIKPKRETDKPKGELGEGEGETDKPKGETDEGEGEEETPKKRRRPGYKRRAEQLVEENDGLKKDLAELRQKFETNGRPALKETKPTAAARPKMEDFEEEADFLDALIDWKAEQKIDDRMAERDKRQTKQDGEDNRRRQAVEAATELDRQFKVGREAHEDYDEVLEAADDIEWSDRHAYAMMLTGVAGEIAYHLGQNPEEAAKLAKLTNPAKISMELGKIQAKIEAAPAKPKEEDPTKGEAAPRPGKKVPKPMKSHVGGGASPPIKDAKYWEEKATPEEYMNREMDKRKALGR